MEQKVLLHRCSNERRYHIDFRGYRATIQCCIALKNNALRMQPPLLLCGDQQSFNIMSPVGLVCFTELWALGNDTNIYLTPQT